jgi:membrane protease YdiL (CAAX protease family)
MNIVDHLLVLVLLVVLPLYVRLFAAPRMQREFAEGGPGRRRRFYWQSVAIQWTAAGGLALFWWLASRDAADLGVVAPEGWRFWVALPVVAAALLAIAVAQQVSLRTPARRAATQKMVRRDAPFAPRDAAELRHWTALSVTAGVCEELVYRGYLIWYASHWTGTGTGGLLLAVLLTSVAFGLGHVYQGPGGVLRVFGTGVAFGMIYVLSGSLWLAMVAHAGVDVLSGCAVVRLHRDGPPSGNEPAEPDADERAAPCGA